MATPAPVPDQSPSPAGGGDVRVILEQFRQLALQTQTLGTRFPEFQEYATQILPLIQKGMTAVVGNSQRVPPAPAPPA